MPLKETDSDYLWDLLEAARAVVRFIHNIVGKVVKAHVPELITLLAAVIPPIPEEGEI